MGSNTMGFGVESFSDSKMIHLAYLGKQYLEIREGKCLRVKDFLLGEAIT
jgi:hypothetical protein